jgi:hypothetical protein
MIPASFEPRDQAVARVVLSLPYLEFSVAQKTGSHYRAGSGSQGTALPNPAPNRLSALEQQGAAAESLDGQRDFVQQMNGRTWKKRPTVRKKIRGLTRVGQ